ncbi:MAG: hypothetical protein ACREOU_10805 [Candidatus Eiseniibacteriota bacterium]
MNAAAVRILGLIACFLLPVSSTGEASLQEGDVVVAAFNRSIHAVDSGTGAITSVSEDGQFNVPMNVAILPDGLSLFVADQSASGGTIFRIDQFQGPQDVVVSGSAVNGVNALALGSDGFLYATRLSGGAGAAGIVRVNTLTGDVVPVSVGGNLALPRDLEFAADGALYVLDVLYNDGTGTGGGAIIRVDTVTGTQTIVSSGQYFQSVQGMGSAADGKFYVVQFRPFARVIEVDGTTGIQSLVTERGMFDAPRDVAVERNGNLLVSDGTPFVPCGVDSCVLPAIIRVDRTTGAQSVLVSGPPLRDLSGIVILEGGGVIGNLPTSWGRMKSIYR